MYFHRLLLTAMIVCVCMAHITKEDEHSCNTAEKEDGGEESDQAPTPTLPLAPPPPMSTAIQAILQERWNDLDAEFEAKLKPLVFSPGFLEFPHGRTVFTKHLVGTWSILQIWKQPQDVCRTGLFHTAYSGDLFQFMFLDGASEADRTTLRETVGEEAEHLIWMFGSVERGKLNTSLVDLPRHTLTKEGLHVPHRFLGEVVLSGEEVAKILLVTIADYFDQMVEVNGWRDHHQVDAPLSLYPGDRRPTIALYWFSSMCLVIRDFLTVVPPIFHNCTVELSLEDERVARDLYWKAVTEEHVLSEKQQEEMLEEACARNPYVGEPHLMLAQLHFRREMYSKAAEEAGKALECFFTLGSAWDKRVTYAYWVGYSRVLMLRARRRYAGLSSLPYDTANDGTVQYTQGNKLPLVSLKTLVDAL